MNNKGFTLIELLATIVVLAIVAGITFAVINVDLVRLKKRLKKYLLIRLRMQLRFI